MLANSNLDKFSIIIPLLVFVATDIVASDKSLNNNFGVNKQLNTKIAYKEELAEARIVIPIATNLKADGRQQQSSKKVILAYVSASYCAFCKKLEKEVLVPAIRSGDYQNKIILRKIDLHGQQPIINFEGQETTPSQFLKKYDIKMTPTLLFLDNQGQQLEEKLIGYQGGEFYWYYLDAAIRKANKQLK